MRLLRPFASAVVLSFALTATFALHAEPGGSCCTKQANGAAPGCCAAKTMSETATSDLHAAHDAATSADGAHAGHRNGADAMSCCTGGGTNPGGMSGRGAVMPDAMRLLHNHAALERTVEDIPNGVRTVTTTSDEHVLALLRRHPREMYSFYESGGVVRPHDPMFNELSRVADKVSMVFKDVENGIEVIATSEDTEVVKLLRAHARKVSDFVERGHAALHEGAPLPDDYRPDH